MKILHCLNHFLPHQVAGTEVYTMALCKGLLKEGIRSEVAIPNYRSAETDHYQYEGISIHRFAENSAVDRSLQMGFREPEGVVSFTTLLKGLQPDIVHFQELAGSNGFTLAHVKAAKAMGLKTVMTFHLAGYSCKSKALVYKDKYACDGIISEQRCSDCMIGKQANFPVSTILASAARLLYKTNIDLSAKPFKIGTALGYPFIIKRLKKDLFKLAEYCDQLVVLTDWYKKILINNNLDPSKIVVNKQGLVNQLADKAVVKTATETLRFIFVGRLSYFKGLHLILDALEQLKDKNITLDVYGQDGKDAYAVNCLNRINSSSNVQWMGALRPTEVVSVMEDYDALLLASTFSEMSPLVIQEAFAANIPVVASNVYGNAEQIEHGINGWLFAFKDAAALARQLKQLSDNPAMLASTKKNIQPPRAFEAVVKEYIKLYTALLS